jgi:hypothetical protein
MKKVTKVEWVIVAEDGLPEEVRSNNFIIKTDDDKVHYCVHFARNLDDIYDVILTEDMNVTHWDKIYFQYGMRNEDKIRIFKEGFFFTINEDPDGPDEYYGYKTIFIQDPKRIIAWAEIVI